jgi:predicted lipoprotein with Yx(FWY)xxD motif
MKLLGATLALAVAGALAAVLATAHAGVGAAKAQVDLRASSLGRILVDDRGRTLYLFAADKGGKSACYGKCATFWPPLLATTARKTGPGLKASLYGTTRRRDGKLQVTYAHHPLYRFAEDKAPGQLKGQGLNAGGGLWWVLAPSGTAVERKAAPAATTTTQATTTTPTTTSGGHGYYP